MFERTVSADDLAHLKRAREEADRAYNEALTVLDGALPKQPVLPRPPAGHEGPFDVLQAGRRLDADQRPTARGGWQGRLHALVWRVIGPIVKRQQHFNTLVVEHLERAAAAEAAQRRAAEAVVQALDGHLEAVAAFHSRLIQFLQQITPYVDTKDREASGLARRITEDAAAQADALERRQQTLAALDTTVAHLQHEVLALRGAGARAAAPAPADSLPATTGVTAKPSDGVDLPAPATADSPPSTTAASAPPPGREDIDASVDAYSYVGFEDRYRGAWEAIRDRQRDYAALFAGASDVLDIGCGRGEFLDLLREAGIAARGVDVNPQMVAACRARGLTATTGDALEFLERLPDGALGGLFSAQVVEHLPPETLIRLVRAAWRKLRPGSTIAIETINPSCWLAFFETYLRDLTHVKPVHPETLRYLLAASGFHDPAIRFRSPVAEADRLRRLPVPDPAAGAPVDARLIDCLQAVNHNVDRLNDLLFSSMDYAVVATRP